MSNRDEIRPPKSIPATPPACAEARAIAKGDEAFAQFKDDLEKRINENTPTWRKVLRNLFKGE
jgi:hypothetical protein